MDHKSKEWTDRAGSVASTLCTLHCAICGLAPGLLAFFGLGFMLSHKAEWALVLVAVVFGLGALILAWRTHRSLRVTAFLTLGIVGLLFSRGLEMGSGHGDHEQEHHSTGAESAGDQHTEEHLGSAQPVELAHDIHGDAHDSHGDAHDSHGDAHEGLMHLAGAGVGVFAGILLLFGHLLNIRRSRQYRDACCD